MRVYGRPKKYSKPTACHLQNQKSAVFALIRTTYLLYSVNDRAGELSILLPTRPP